MAGIIADLTVVLKSDNKDFNKGVAGAQSKTQKMKNAIKANMGEIKVAAFAATAAITAAIGFSIKQAQAAEKSNALLANSLKNMGVTGDKTAKQMESLASALQKTTGIGDEDLKDAMTILNNITGDYNVALEHTETVANLAAGANIDLKTAAQLVGRSFLGDTTMLKRYGIVLKEGITGTAALEAINKRFFGSAAARLDTFDGQVTNLKNTLSDFGESAGITLLPFLTQFIKDVDKAVMFWDRFINKGKETERTLNPALKKINEQIKEQETNLAALVVKQNTVALNQNQWDGTMLQYENIKKKIAELRDEYAKLDTQIKKNTLSAADIKKKAAEDAAAKKIAADKLAAEKQEELDRLKLFEKQVSDTTDTVAGAFMEMGAAIVENEMNIAEGLKTFAKAGIAAVLDVLAIRAKANLAISVAELLGGNPAASAGIAGWGTAIAGIEALKIGVMSLASGGIAASPTLAMVGDNRRSPEVVAPLHELMPMISNAVNNTSSATLVFNIQDTGLSNAAKVTRQEIIPQIEKYFNNKGVKNDFTK